MLVMRNFFDGLFRMMSLILILSYSVHTHSEELKFITLNVAPWAYFNKNKSKLLGVFPDLVHEIEKRTGNNIHVSLTFFAFDRINRELELGRQDCTMVIREKKRDQFVILGESVVELSMGVVAKKGINLDEYKDLYGLRISVLKILSEKGKFMDDNQLTKVFDTDYEAGLRKMQHRRLEAIAGPIGKIQYLARKNGFDDLLGAPLVLKQEPIHLQCSKKSKNLKHLDKLNQAIKSIKSDGTLAKIIKRNS
jgi:polar amino acid transport system substrate-binding protein